MNNKTSTLCRAAISALAAMSLVGCATQQMAQDRFQKAEKKQQGIVDQFPKEDPTPRFGEFTSGFFFGNNLVPLETEKVLPPVFAKPDSHKITLVDAGGRVSLSGLAERLTRTTGIPVYINPDVSVRSASAAQVQAATTGAMATPPTPGIPILSGSGMPSPVAGGAVTNVAGDFEANLTLNYTGSLAKFLDLVVSRLGISWEYNDGRINFFRYKTKTFEVQAGAETKKTSSNFSSSGQSQSAGGSTGGNSTQGLEVGQKSEGEFNVWKDIAKDLGVMKSNGGDFSVNPTTGTVTVTDVPQKLREIEEYLKDTNRRMTRSIYLKAQIVTLKKSSASQFGFDLNAVVTAASGKFRMVTAASNTLLDATIPTAGGFWLAPPGGKVPSLGSPGGIGDGLSNFDGSGLFIKALYDTGIAAEAITKDGYTVNNEPIIFTSVITKKYVSSTGATQSQTSTQTQVQQDTAVSGIFMTLKPRILDNNQVLLNFKVDLSDRPTFETTPAGEVVVKSPEQPSRKVDMTMRLPVGRTSVVSGMSLSSSNDGSQYGMGAAWKAGVSDESMMILITPILM